MLKLFILTLMISTIRADASCFCKDYTYNTKKNKALFQDPSKIPSFLEEILRALVGKYNLVSESSQTYPSLQLVSFLHGTRGPAKKQTAVAGATATTDSVARRMVFVLKNRQKKLLFDFVYLYIEAIEMKKKKNFSLHFSTKRRDTDTIATEAKFMTAYALVDTGYIRRKKSPLAEFGKEIFEDHAFNQYHSNEFAYDTCVHFSIFLNKILRAYFEVDSYKVVNQVSPLGLLYHESGEKCQFVPTQKLEYVSQDDIDEQRMKTPSQKSGQKTPITKIDSEEEEEEDENFQRRDNGKNSGTGHPTFIVRRQDSSPLRQKTEGANDLPLLGGQKNDRQQQMAPRQNRFENEDTPDRERDASPSNNERKKIKKDSPIKNVVPAKNVPVEQKAQPKVAKEPVQPETRDNRFKELVPNKDKKPSAWQQKMQKYKQDHPDENAEAKKNKDAKNWSPVNPQKEVVEEVQELRQRNSPIKPGFGLLAPQKKGSDELPAQNLAQREDEQALALRRAENQPPLKIDDDEEDEEEDFRQQVDKKDLQTAKMNVVVRRIIPATEEELEADRKAVAQEVFLPNKFDVNPKPASPKKDQTPQKIVIESQPIESYLVDINTEENAYNDYLKFAPQDESDSLRLKHAMQLKFGEVVLTEEEEIIYMDQLKVVLSNAQRSIEQILVDYELVLKSGLFIDDDQGKTVFFTSSQQEEELYKLDHPGNPIFYDFYKPTSDQILDFKIKSKFVEHIIDLVADLVNETPENKELLGFPEKFTYKIYSDLTMKISPKSALKRLLMIALAYNEYQLKQVVEIQSEVDLIKAAVSLEFTYSKERSRLMGTLLFWRNTDLLTDARRRQLVQEAMDKFAKESNIDPAAIKSSNIEVLVTQMGSYRLLI